MISCVPSSLTFACKQDILDDPIDYAMVKSINDVGHVMGKLTIAEFVENPETLDAVTELGAEYAQGFAIGRAFVLAPCFSRSGAEDVAAALISDQAV